MYREPRIKIRIDMKHIDADLLRKEIETLKDEYTDIAIDSQRGWVNANFVIDDLERLQSQIDSLQQEQLPGIEEHGIPGKDFIPVEWVDACEKYGKWKIVQQEQPSLPSDLDEAAEEYLKYHKLETASIRKLSMYRSLAFKAGAEWQKEQMMKEAVDGYVNYYEDSGGILMAEAQVGCPYHNGDKVRIVVLKAEEEKK